jgi:thymidylate synthase ThyX
MNAALVYDGRDVRVPLVMGTPRNDQMNGTAAEQLVEVAGRVCYDSMGTGRPSGEYHHNLLNVQQHYSVAEHPHRTLVAESVVDCVWLGMPDVSVAREGNGGRITFNLRHALEWPSNVTFRSSQLDYEPQLIRWQRVLQQAAHAMVPSACKDNPWRAGDAEWEFQPPKYDTECFISVFMEDSLVWSLEQNRHRGNISQRSGRFVDQTDRKMCCHPMVRDYLNELGSLPEDEEHQQGGAGPKDPNDLTPIFTGNLEPAEANKRLRIGNAIGSLTAQMKMTYMAVVEQLQPWLEAKQGLDKFTARKQARSAARYYLGQGLSTEAVYTYSVRHWNHIFKMRCSPHADAAIRELAEETRAMLKRESQYAEMIQ